MRTAHVPPHQPTSESRAERRQGAGQLHLARPRLPRVEVIGRWHLQDRWWDHERESDRTYYRLLTADHMVFEIYQEKTSKGLWVLDGAPCGALA